MRIGVIRGDLPQKIHLVGLEPISQFNPEIEPEGQEYYLARPTEDSVNRALAVVPASFESSGSIVFPLVINGANQTLKLRQATSGAYTSVTVPAGTYNDIDELITAVQLGLNAAGVTVEADRGSTDVKLSLKNTALFGAGTTLETDSVAGGSTFNTPAAFGAAARTFTVATAAAIIAATLPVGGPLDVRVVTLTPLIGSATAIDDRGQVFADVIAPRVYQTSVVEDSLKSGVLSKLLSLSYTPNPVTLPAGPAIVIVQDDGNTPLISFGLPTIATAVLAGNLTLTGTFMCDPETEEMVVSIAGVPPKKIYQRQITQAGGTVAASSIVVPASLLSGVAIATHSAKVQFRSFMSNSVVISL